LIEEAEPLALLSGVADRGSRSDALAAIADHDPDGWAEVWAEWLLHEETPQLLRDMTARLESEGRARV
jgi:hypothetical protein